MIFKIIKIFFENRRKTSKLVETFREPSVKQKNQRKAFQKPVIAGS